MKAGRAGGSVERLLPRLKPMLAGSVATGAEGIPAAELPLSRSLGVLAAVVYCLEEVERFVLISRRMLGEMGMDEEELHRASLVALDVRARARLKVEGEACKLLTMGGCEASLLLLDPFWDSIRCAGDVVAAAPKEDLLFFSHTGSEEGMAQLREMHERFSEGYPLIAPLLRRIAGGWEAFGVT